MKKEFSVEGMHCEKCAARVENAVKSVDEGASVKINLKKKSVVIKSDDLKADAVYIDAITEAGYSVL